MSKTSYSPHRLHPSFETSLPSPYIFKSRSVLPEYTALSSCSHCFITHIQAVAKSFCFCVYWAPLLWFQGTVASAVSVQFCLCPHLHCFNLEGPVSFLYNPWHPQRFLLTSSAFQTCFFRAVLQKIA